MSVAVLERQLQSDQRRKFAGLEEVEINPPRQVELLRPSELPRYNLGQRGSIPREPMKSRHSAGCPKCTKPAGLCGVGQTRTSGVSRDFSSMWSICGPANHATRKSSAHCTSCSNAMISPFAKIRHDAFAISKAATVGTSVCPIRSMPSILCIAGRRQFARTRHLF